MKKSKSLMSRYCQFIDIYIDNEGKCMVITNQTDNQQDISSLSPILLAIMC